MGYYMGDDMLVREGRCMITVLGSVFPDYWSDSSEIVDNQWHDINLRILRNLIQVTLDGSTVIDTVVADFEFKGSVLAFFGGSGAVHALQRFDDPVIRTGCSSP